MRLKIFLTVIGIVLLSGCGRLPPDVPTTPVPQEVIKTSKKINQSNSWTQIDDGVERLVYTKKEADNKTEVVLYRFELDQYSFKFVNNEDALLLTDWIEKFPKASLVINGSYFHEDNLPSGYLAIDSKQIGERMFDFNRTGFVAFSPEFRIFQPESIKDLDGIGNGAQSYPFLIKGGTVSVGTNSGLLARRTFIGNDKEYLYIGVVAEDLVSLHDLSKILTEMDVDWNNVLNLDGGNSTMLYSKFEKFEEKKNGYAAVPNAIIVEKKN